MVYFFCASATRPGENPRTIRRYVYNDYNDYGDYYGVEMTKNPVIETFFVKGSTFFASTGKKFVKNSILFDKREHFFLKTAY